MPMALLIGKILYKNKVPDIEPVQRWISTLKNELKGGHQLHRVCTSLT